MSNNVSQRSNKRKFRSIECDCAFCNTWTYPNPSPNWECFCGDCTSITQEEMDETLNTSDFVQILRRANNVECDCGLCATCIPDTQYSYTVYRHRISRVACECPICADYNAEIANVEVANAEVANAEIANAEVTNAEVTNAEVANVDSTQRKQRKRRKFHSPLCNCFFCVDFYETNTSKTDPTWQCFCPDCTDIESTEMEETLNTSDLKQFLRRANNCECRCGVCATCVSDAEFFYTVYRHKESDEQCVCPFCRHHLHYLTTYFF